MATTNLTLDTTYRRIVALGDAFLLTLPFTTRQDVEVAVADFTTYGDAYQGEVADLTLSKPSSPRPMVTCTWCRPCGPSIPGTPMAARKRPVPGWRATRWTPWWVLRGTACAGTGWTP